MSTPVYRTKRRGMPLWKHVLALLILPGTAILAVPAGILWAMGEFEPRWTFEADAHYAVVAAGAFLVVLGLVLVLRAASLLRKAGRGTLAPWSPPRRLVVRGIYGRMRNPIVLGLAIVLVGESLIMGSPALAVWFLVFMIGHLLYIPLKEERDLARRFGEAYDLYSENVPRWFPRLRTWEPSYDVERPERWVSVDSPA